MESDLIKQYQHTKLGNAFSDWESITAGMPQGSILGLLLLNIFMNEIFLVNVSDVYTNV